MMRMIQSRTATQAKEYFDGALSKSDYYTEDQELEGYFHGKVASRLGFDNAQTMREAFHALCDNIDPLTGNKLNPRTKPDRTIGYDINFHCPKSVSLLHVMSGDEKVLETFRQSVIETMTEIEKDFKTRVRVRGKDENRDTGEMIYAEFVHQTARPVDSQLPDPHLHAHCFVFNTTWDEKEGRFKAAQFRDIKRDMPYYQAFFQKTLADKLSDLGYDIEKTSKAFEVRQISKDAVKLFSKRTDEIGRFAKEKGITDPKQLDQLGARTRAKKSKGHSMADLRVNWKDQIVHEGIDFNSEPINGQTNHVTVDQCLDHAIDHSFERASVIAERRLLAKAYHHAIDRSSIRVNNIDQAYRSDQRLFGVNDGYQTLVTTRSVQFEEKRMLDLAKKGRGILNPLKLYADQSDFEGLNQEQSYAVRHVVGSSDRVSFIRGGAGTGKTTLTKTAVHEFNSMGKQVYLFAPTAEASRGVLREEGFENADTVKTLLSDRELQDQIKDQVVWVDEAGLLGTKDMSDILSLAEEKNARVVLSGDTRQHTAVRRGDALRIMQKMGGLNPASVNKIYRQKPVEYRKAVEDISTGDIKSGFDRLDQLGSIKEMETDLWTDQLSKDYMEGLKEGKSSLVISPTNEQSRLVTDKIRQSLKEGNLIGKRDKQFQSLRNLHLTEAEKTDPRSFETGQVIQFHQNVTGIKKGSRCEVISQSKDQVSIQDDQGQKHQLDLQYPDRFDVYQSTQISLSKNDLISVTKNSFDMEGNRLNNGATLKVKGIDKEGVITANNPNGRGRDYKLDKDFGNFKHAYCMTSYGSQGKTVDRVFIAQPASTFPATSQKQFYVSVSRGRENVTLYTDDKKELLEHASRHGDRLSATELDALHSRGRIPSRDKDIGRDLNKNQSGYEPEI